MLWILAFLTVVATALAQQARTETLMARTLVSTAQARGAAGGGVEIAVWGLMRGGVGRARWPADGTVGELEIDGAIVRVAAIAESSKIDLNEVRAEGLRALLLRAGVDEALIPLLVDAILDWRDPDDLRRVHGAEDADYERANRSYGAKDGPFTSVDELRLVLGMTPALYDRIRPALTVFGGHGGMQGNQASPLSWQTLLDAALADTGEDGEVSAPGGAGEPQWGAAQVTRATYTILAHARVPDGATARIVATVRFQPSATGDPVQVLEWRADPGGFDAVFAALAAASTERLWESGS